MPRPLVSSPKEELFQVISNSYNQSLGVLQGSFIMYAIIIILVCKRSFLNGNRKQELSLPTFIDSKAQKKAYLKINLHHIKSKESQSQLGVLQGIVVRVLDWRSGGHLFKPRPFPPLGIPNDLMLYQSLVFPTICLRSVESLLH